MMLNELYDGSEDMANYFDLPIDKIKTDITKWNFVIKNHLTRINSSKKVLHLPSIDKPFEDMKWVNTDKPISFEKDLLGKIVVVDFFTYCCINCEHILPQLRAVEEEFADNTGIAVIGVHSPKFPNEKKIKNVRNAVFKSKISHPVLNDSENSIWKLMGVYCWPTVLILSPAHVVLFSMTGESQIDKLSHLLRETSKFFAAQKSLLNCRSLPSVLQKSDDTSKVFCYPTNVTLLKDFVVVSDTGHNRLIILSLEGEIIHIIGNGVADHQDGSFSDASFNCPHGTVYYPPNNIFVADTRNHSIRKLDLLKQTVETVFIDKNHEIGFSDPEENVVRPKFSSPWDLCIGSVSGPDFHDEAIYVTVAGSHQIWKLSNFQEPETGVVKCIPFAGNGKEECRNNFYLMSAGFAQPSGITFSQRTLFVADSESSTIRSISLIDKAVKTVVGGSPNPNDLFQYGDADGKQKNVKLQHPLDVSATDDGKIYVADTYNHKIKVVDIHNQTCKSLILEDCEKLSESETLFKEPSGICYNEKNQSLIVADTNNHLLKIIDLKTNIIKTVNVSSSDCLDGLSISDFQQTLCAAPIPRSVIELSPTYNQNTQFKPILIELKSDGEIHLSFLVKTEGVSLTLDSPQSWDISFIGGRDWKVVCSGGLFQNNIQPSLMLKCLSDAGRSGSEVVLNLKVSVCDDKKKTCIILCPQLVLKITSSIAGCKIFNLDVLL